MSDSEMRRLLNICEGNNPVTEATHQYGLRDPHADAAHYAAHGEPSEIPDDVIDSWLKDYAVSFKESLRNVLHSDEVDCTVIASYYMPEILEVRQEFNGVELLEKALSTKDENTIYKVLVGFLFRNADVGDAEKCMVLREPLKKGDGSEHTQKGMLDYFKMISSSPAGYDITDILMYVADCAVDETTMIEKASEYIENSDYGKPDPY